MAPRLTCRTAASVLALSAWCATTPSFADITISNYCNTNGPVPVRIGNTSNQTGTVTINGGSVLNAAGAGITMAVVPNSTGILNIDGSGSSLLLANLKVCANGTGQVNVTNGGSLSSIFMDAGVTAALGSGTITIDGTGSSLQAAQLSLGITRPGTLNVTNNATANVTAFVLTSFGGTIHLDSGGTLNTGSLVAAKNNLTGKGTINTRGLVSDIDLLFDATHGSQQILKLNQQGRDITINLSADAGGTFGILGAGADASSSMTIRDGVHIISTGNGAFGTQADATGTLNINGMGSTWRLNNFLDIGTNGTGIANITDGGQLIVSQHVNVKTYSRLNMDVGTGSLLDVSADTFTNNGIVRLTATAQALAGTAYKPILAGTWAGTGTYQTVGGTWNANTHEFLTSAAESGSIGTSTTIDRHRTQRILISDSQGHPKVGASFLSSDSQADLTFTASELDSNQSQSLQLAVGSGNTILAGWQFTVEGHADGEPVTLSFDIGDGLTGTDLKVWHYDSTNGWQDYTSQITDLSYDGQFANFTVTGFSDYAVTAAVPEPASLLIMLPATLMAITSRRRKI